MTAIGKIQYVFPLLLFLSIYNSNVMSHNLQMTSMAERHEQWIKKHGVVYEDDTEKQKRFLIFKNNVEYIESFNAVGNKSYKLAINHFADLTNSEFTASYSSGYKRSYESRTIQTSFKYENLSNDIPTAVDWREKGAVSPVKNQGKCNCCWAFSAVTSIEGIYKIATGFLMSLSTQQLVDCDVLNNGCRGGTMVRAFEFIKRNGGITTEENYPYVQAKGKCDKSKDKLFKIKVRGYQRLPPNREDYILNAVANHPVSVAVDSVSGSSDFQFYSGGIFRGSCGNRLDHAVAIVGYGITREGIKYWIVKNSWGTQWGEDGYIRMERNINNYKEGLCGIAMDPSYPYL
ncbi:Senescence-specific cysteine protease SAG39, partial [Mucuna pruriens]